LAIQFSKSSVSAEKGEKMRSLFETALSLIIALATQPGFAKSHDPNVLSLLLDRVGLTVQKGSQPVVVLDLDDTLIITRERNIRILQEFAKEPTTAAQYPDEAQQLSSLLVSEIKYSVSDTLKNIGIVNAEFHRLAQEYWSERFFTDKYCATDQPTVGAARYLHLLNRAGAKIIYLTGRDMPRMGKGTAYNLGRNRFPGPNQETVLMMKPDPKMDDLEFKKQALTEIALLGEVVGVVENEPANLNAMMAKWPQAIGIFLDTVHSSKPDQPDPNASWITNFKLKL
jgi:hypothetical protein